MWLVVRGVALLKSVLKWHLMQSLLVCSRRLARNPRSVFQILGGCRLLSGMSLPEPEEEGSSLAVCMADVQEAMERIRGDVHLTPCMQCSHLDTLADLELHFKCELFQKAGSFKIRGATNAVKKLQETRTGDDLRVVTHSSGNHAQALALAARNCGLPAEIVMPSNSPTVKVQAVKSYGGRVTMCHPSEQGRKDAAASLVNKYAPNAVLIPSSNHPDIMAGQGTISMELLNQVPELDAIIASVSGGGFVAGMAIAAKALRPGIKIFAAEPKNADDCAKSLAAGRIIPNESWPDTICDALKVNICDLTWPILKTHLSGVITVTEEEVVTAMRTVWERMNITVEPAAACTVAAVLSPKFKELAGPDVKRVGVVLCGGNVDLDNLPWTHST